MGVLITAIGSWVTTIFTSLLNGVSKKAFAYAYIGAFVLLTVAFMNTVNGLIPSLMLGSTPGGFVLAGLSLVPSNAPSCIAAVGAGHLARWIFLWKAKFIKSWMVD